MSNPLMEDKAGAKGTQDARNGLFRRDLFVYEIPTGHAISCPVPRKGTNSVLLAQFIYPAPAVPSGTPGTVGRPRYWLVTTPREPHIVLFADCQFLDLAAGGGYRDEFWSRPDPPVDSIAERKELENQLFEALDGFIDQAFSPASDLDEPARACVSQYCGLLAKLTPEPLTKYLHEISPEFWNWADGL